MLEYQFFRLVADPSAEHQERAKGAHELIFIRPVADAARFNETDVLSEIKGDGWENIKIVEWFSITRDALAKDPAKREELEKATNGRGIVLDYADQKRP